MVQVIGEGRARPITSGESVTGVDDGDDGTDWEPDTTSELPPGDDPGDVLTWDGDSWEPASPGADQWKQPVRVATTANITISTALNNGDSIDGVTLATGDRVLVKDQSTGAQNGIYVVGASPARATDLDADSEVLGAVVYVIAGTANGGTAWRVTNTAATVVGTDAITWGAFGGSGGSLTVADEGTPLSSAATTLDFVGDGVVASGTGATKTITIPGAATAFAGARVTNGAATSITTATPTAVPFATEDFDTNGYHDTVTNNTRVTVPSGLGGKHRITAQGCYNVANLAGVYFYLRKNGSTVIAYVGYTGQETGIGAGYNLSADVDLSAGDYVELITNQSSGSSRALEATAGYNWLSIVRLGGTGSGIVASTFSPTSDGYLDSTAATTNRDADTTFTMGGDPADTTFSRRVVMTFDLSSVAGKTIYSARLRLARTVLNGVLAAGQSLVGFRVLRAYVANQVTWNVYSTGNNWTTAGARSSGNDISATRHHCGMLATPNINVTTRHVFDVTSLMQECIDAGDTTAFRWLFQGDELDTAQNAMQFGAQDNATANLRPVLVVTHSA